MLRKIRIWFPSSPMTKMTNIEWHLLLLLLLLLNMIVRIVFRSCFVGIHFIFLGRRLNILSPPKHLKLYSRRTLFCLNMFSFLYIIGEISWNGDQRYGVVIYLYLHIWWIKYAILDYIYISKMVITYPKFWCFWI